MFIDVIFVIIYCHRLARWREGVAKLIVLFLFSTTTTTAMQNGLSGVFSLFYVWRQWPVAIVSSLTLCFIFQVLFLLFVLWCVLWALLLIAAFHLLTLLQYLPQVSIPVIAVNSCPLSGCELFVVPCTHPNNRLIIELHWPQLCN